MDFTRTSLILCILFIFHLQQNIPSVSSQSSPVDMNHNNETLLFNASTPDVLEFEGKYRELAVVIKRRGGGGGGSRRGGTGSSQRGGSSRGGDSRGSGGGSLSRSRGGVYSVHTGSGSHRSSGSRNLRGTIGVYAGFSRFMFSSIGYSLSSGLVYKVCV